MLVRRSGAVDKAIEFLEPSRGFWRVYLPEPLLRDSCLFAPLSLTTQRLRESVFLLAWNSTARAPWTRVFRRKQSPRLVILPREVCLHLRTAWDKSEPGGKVSTVRKRAQSRDGSNKRHRLRSVPRREPSSRVAERMLLSDSFYLLCVEG